MFNARYMFSGHFEKEEILKYVFKICLKYVLLKNTFFSLRTGSSLPVSNAEVITIASPYLHTRSVVLEYRRIHWRTSKNRGSELHRDNISDLQYADCNAG